MRGVLLDKFCAGVFTIIALDVMPIGHFQDCRANPRKRAEAGGTWIEQ